MAGLSFGTPTTSAPSFSLGSNTTNTGGTPGFGFGTSASVSTAPTGLQFSAPSTNTGSVPFATTSAPGGSGFSFTSGGGLSMGTPTTTQSTLFKPGGLSFGSPAGQQPTLGFSTPATTTAVTTGLTFGNTPSSIQQTLSFGTTPTTNQALSFGTTPATSQAISFGTTPAASQALSFGTTPATSQALSFGNNPATSQALNFGSTPATSQALNFGTTPATSQALSFGTTPATSQTLTFGTNPVASQALNFGSTPATTQPTLNFGNTPTTSQPLSFGSSLGTTQPSLTFGSVQPTPRAGFAPTVTQTMLNFGQSTPATTASTGFSLGTTPATTGTGLTFGLGNQAATPKPTFGLTTTTAAATSAPTLLNFSAPKTTATTGFSLSVSAGTGSLFSLPSTTAPTTTAPLAFKGLGGVDTSATQGSGLKDAKSVKETPVNAEIMQTLDVFKNFVKQQKNLSCEVSRAPVKPMHKVTEDTEALKQLLTTVLSALQKSRVIANKLKADTTKCLSLCEMAQRTHDTPPGLQNDNVAPLEFFIQLVNKFERDIQMLRQEIDNTEKHVNSLSFPAILTPQELSIALRRLHDSFVALAGRLQTAHAGVIAQKERHLSLRRQFLKDSTNIFETSSTRSSAAKKPQCGITPMTGPTPFSSMGGINNFSMLAGQNKPVTFSTGPISGWGSSTMTGLSATPSSNFLQTPGTSILGTPQPVDNQNFQLGKPPPGNKRGKR